MGILPSQKLLLILGAFLGFVSVGAGAFGAHVLKQKLTADLAAIFEVGVRYQMYHALAMGLAAWVVGVVPNGWVWASGWMFFAGTVIFSGSLYILALTAVRAWGAVTPIGGVILLLGWLCLAIGVIIS
jgi:uncharacterized membrane protein YgdD (TMEM256/DUF423 family)